MQDYIYIKSNNINVKLSLADILYVRAERKYLRIFAVGKTYFIRGTMSSFQEIVGLQENFCRIHKSYIISLSKLSGFDRKCVFLDGAKLPIGRQYKNELKSSIESLGLQRHNKEARVLPFFNPVDSLFQKVGSKIVKGGSITSVLLYMEMCS